MSSNVGQKYLFPIPDAGEIALTAKQIICAIKADHPDVSDEYLAKLIGGKDKGSIERLERLETKKVPATVFSNLAAKYGTEYIQPYMSLFGHKAVPQHCEEAVNALPALTSLAAKIAASLTDGRTEINHQALAGMLHELRDVDAVVVNLRARASELGLAA